jgi:hypothetical protein
VSGNDDGKPEEEVTRPTMQSPALATEPSGMPNALLLTLAVEQWPHVQEFVAALPETPADHRSMLAAARVLLSQIPLSSLGAVAEGSLPYMHTQRIEEATALLGLILKSQGKTSTRRTTLRVRSRNP